MMPTDTGVALPDLSRFQNGALVQSREDWRVRRQEVFDAVIPLQYGGIPPTPQWSRGETLHASPVARLNGARNTTCRVVTGLDQPFSFALNLLVPAGDGPFPVVIDGDACWRYVTDEIAAEVLRRGNILAQFNRVELAADVPDADRSTGIYPLYPGETFGALAAWAWGYHRCVDVLTTMEFRG
jgi:hypothetical protein